MPESAPIFGGSHDQRRPSARKRGYDKAHEIRRRACLLRAMYTCECPGCPECSQTKDRACGAEATVADHREAHRGDADKLTDEGNYQALCQACHAHKTLRLGE